MLNNSIGSKGQHFYPFYENISNIYLLSSNKLYFFFQFHLFIWLTKSSNKCMGFIMVHLILSMQERKVDEKFAKTPHSCFPNMFFDPILFLFYSCILFFQCFMSEHFVLMFDLKTFVHVALLLYFNILPTTMILINSN